MTAAAALSAQAFQFDLNTPEKTSRWRARVQYLLDSDPAGGFVAEQDGRIVGLAQAMLRDGVWCLSLLTVDPQTQSAGAGRALLDATLAYGRGSRRGALIVSSNDPRAITLYARAGFAVRPTLALSGEPRDLPAPSPAVREVGIAELEGLAPISRAIRGAAHTAELRFQLQARGGRILALADRGFVVSDERHPVWLLAARDVPAAEALLIAALARAPAGDWLIGWVTAEQQWALRLAARHGLRVRTDGALCVQGELGPLAPYLPSPSFA